MLALAAAPINAAGPVAALFIGLLVVFVVWLDLLISASPRQLAARRDVADKLSLGADNTVVLRFESACSHVVALSIRDEPPHAFGKAGPLLALVVPPFSTAAVSYPVRPDRRGDFRFGSLNARWRTRFGLLWRQHTWRLGQAVKVYPNLRDVQRYELMLRRGMRLETGLRRSRKRGAGSDFERLRDYGRDDDYRRINWAATARRHEPIIADFEVERAQYVMIVLDAGRTMAAVAERGHGGLTKLDHAVNTALMLAFACQRRGDRVGLLAFADHVLSYAQPAPGKRQFLRILELLYNVQPQPVESDFGAAMEYARRRFRRRSLLPVFTDVLDVESSASLVAHLSALSTRHIPVCVVLTDPDVEDATLHIPSTSQDVYERAVALELLEQRGVVLATLRSHGVLTIDVPSDKLTPAVIDLYLNLKNQGRL